MGLGARHWRPPAGRPVRVSESRRFRRSLACRSRISPPTIRRLRQGNHGVSRGAARQRRSRRGPRESRHVRGAARPPARGRGRLARGDCAAAAVRPGYVYLAESSAPSAGSRKPSACFATPSRRCRQRPTPFNALGLSLARQHRLPEALDALARAAALEPDHRVSRTCWPWRIPTRARTRSISTLERAHRRHPADLDILRALI